MLAIIVASIPSSFFLIDFFEIETIDSTSINAWRMRQTDSQKVRYHTRGREKTSRYDTKRNKIRLFLNIVLYFASYFCKV